MRDWPARPTDAQLHAAWRRCMRPWWPATYAACMADPLYSQLVRANAIRDLLAARLIAGRTAGLSPAPAASSAPTPEPPAAAPNTQAARPTAGIDLKRAAAGDRDD